MCRRSTSSAWMTAHSELTGFQNPPSARRHTYRFSPTWTKSGHIGKYVARLTAVPAQPVSLPIC